MNKKFEESIDFFTWDISLYYGFHDYDNEDDYNKKFVMIFDKSVTKEEIEGLLLNRYSNYRCVAIKAELRDIDEKNIF